MATWTFKGEYVRAKLEDKLKQMTKDAMMSEAADKSAQFLSRTTYVRPKPRGNHLEEERMRIGFEAAREIYKCVKQYETTEKISFRLELNEEAATYIKEFDFNTKWLLEIFAEEFAKLQEKQKRIKELWEITENAESVQFSEAELRYLDFR